MMVAEMLAMFTDLGFDKPLLLAVKVAAALGGAFVGWLLGGPVCRLLVRGAFHRPASPAVVLGGRFAGAGLVALLVFTLIQGLGGGFGFGPGQGGGPGKGPGDGSGTIAANKSAADTTNESSSQYREVVRIELLGGKRYKMDKRYYLLNRQEPAKTLAEVEQYFKENQGRLQVDIILTLKNDSVGESHHAVTSLRRLGDKYDIPSKTKTIP